jgi:hypothetical protein
MSEAAVDHSTVTELQALSTAGSPSLALSAILLPSAFA